MAITKKFYFTNQNQTFTVPKGFAGTATVHLWGAGGAGGGGDAYAGGDGCAGQYVTGTITVRPNDTITVAVGGAGKRGRASNVTSLAVNRVDAVGLGGGSYEGYQGGKGGLPGPTGFSGGGGGGGGATVVLINSRPVAIAAGGGGGGGGGAYAVGGNARVETAGGLVPAGHNGADHIGDGPGGGGGGGGAAGGLGGRGADGDSLRAPAAGGQLGGAQTPTGGSFTNPVGKTISSTPVTVLGITPEIVDGSDTVSLGGSGQVLSINPQTGAVSIVTDSTDGRPGYAVIIFDLAVGIYNKISGTWKSVTQPKVKTALGWKNVTNAWYKENGTWKLVYTTPTVNVTTTGTNWRLAGSGVPSTSTVGSGGIPKLRLSVDKTSVSETNVRDFTITVDSIDLTDGSPIRLDYNSGTAVNGVDVTLDGTPTGGALPTIVPVQNNRAVVRGRVVADNPITGSRRMYYYNPSGVILPSGPQQWIGSTPGIYEFTVPVGVTSFTVDFRGAGGGAGGADAESKGADGFGGDKLTGTMNVAPGDIIKVEIGTGGQGGTGDTAGAAGGAGGFVEGNARNGGAGGASGGSGRSGSGGGGGAATAIYVNNVLRFVAAGGGGGGGAGKNGPGGPQATTSAPTGVGGAGQARSGDGGGGGGGGGGAPGGAGGPSAASDTGGTSGAQGTSQFSGPSGTLTKSVANNGGTAVLGRVVNGAGSNGYAEFNWTGNWFVSLPPWLEPGVEPITFNNPATDLPGLGTRSFTIPVNFPGQSQNQVWEGTVTAGTLNLSRISGPLVPTVTIPGSMNIGTDYTLPISSNNSFGGSSLVVTVYDITTNTTISADGVVLRSDGSGSYTFRSSAAVFPNGRQIRVTFSSRTSDVYTFKAWGDDLTRIYVDDQLIVEGTIVQPKETTATISAGVHTVKVENVNLTTLPNNWTQNPAYVAAQIFGSTGTRIFYTGQLVTNNPLEGDETLVIKAYQDNNFFGEATITIREQDIVAAGEVWGLSFSKASAVSTDTFTLTVNASNGVSSGKSVGISFTGSGIAEFVKQTDGSAPPATLTISGNGQTGTASVNLKLGTGYVNSTEKTLTALLTVDGQTRATATMVVVAGTVQTGCVIQPDVLISSLDEPPITHGRVIRNAKRIPVNFGSATGAAGFRFSGFGNNTVPRLEWNGRTVSAEPDSGQGVYEVALKIFKDSATPETGYIVIDGAAPGRVEQILCPTVDQWVTTGSTNPSMSKSTRWGQLLNDHGAWPAVPYIQTMTEAAYGPYIPGNSLASSPIPGSAQIWTAHNQSIVTSYVQIENVPADEYVMVRQVYNGWLKVWYSTNGSAGPWNVVGRLPATGLAKDTPYCYNANSAKETAEQCRYTWTHPGGTILFRVDTLLTDDTDPFGGIVIQLFKKSAFDNAVTTGPAVGPCEQSTSYSQFTKDYGVWFKDEPRKIGTLTKEYELNITETGVYEVLMAVDDTLDLYFRTPPGSYTLFSHRENTAGKSVPDQQTITFSTTGKHYLKISATNTNANTPGAVAVLIRKQSSQATLFETRGYSANQLSPNLVGAINTYVFDPEAGIEEYLISDSGWGVSQRYQGGRTTYSNVLTSGITYLGDGTTYGYVSRTGNDVVNNQTYYNMVTGSTVAISKGYALVPYANLGRTGTSVRDLLGISNSACPAPWTKITLADGTLCEAGQLQVGQEVYTRHETTGQWGNFTVSHVSIQQSNRWKLTLGDGTEFVGTPDHRVLCDTGVWKEIQDLTAGDKLVKPEGQCVEVSSVAYHDHGDIVLITVDDAHTYLTEGFVSHNVQNIYQSLNGSLGADDPTGRVLGPDQQDSSIGPVTYTVNPTSTSVSEGNTVTWNISSNNSDGITLYWRIDGATTTDFTDGVAQDTVTTSANAASITKTISNDGITEGTESYVLQLYADAGFTTLLATAPAVAVADTSGGSPSGTYPNRYADFLAALNSSRNFVVLNYGLEEAYRNNATYTNKYTPAQFEIDLTSAVNQLKSQGKTVVIQTPNRVRQDGPSPDFHGTSRDWKSTLTQYAQKCRDVASATNVFLHDKWNSTIWTREGDAAWPAGALEPTDKVYTDLGTELGALILANAPRAPATFGQTGPNLFSSYMNSQANVPYRNLVGYGPNNALEFRTTASNQPFGDSVNLTWQQRMEVFYDGGTGAVAQLSVFMYFQNTANQVIGFIINSYDNRPGYLNYTPTVGQADNTFFVSTPVGNTRYCNSANTHTVTAPGLPYVPGTGSLINYSVTVSKQNFENALADLASSGITGAANTWKLVSGGIIHSFLLFGDPNKVCETAASFSTVRITSSTAQATNSSQSTVIIDNSSPAWNLRENINPYQQLP